MNLKKTLGTLILSLGIAASAAFASPLEKSDYKLNFSLSQRDAYTHYLQRDRRLKPDPFPFLQDYLRRSGKDSVIIRSREYGMPIIVPNLSRYSDKEIIIPDMRQHNMPIIRPNDSFVLPKEFFQPRRDLPFYDMNRKRPWLRYI